MINIKIGVPTLAWTRTRKPAPVTLMPGVPKIKAERKSKTGGSDARGYLGTLPVFTDGYPDQKKRYTRLQE